MPELTRLPPADRLTLGCMVLHFLACGVVAALTGSWEIALAVGLPALAVPGWMTWRYPGTTLAHVTVAVGMTSFTALIIQQTGGEMEAHFSFFVMMSVLVIYADWRLLWLMVGLILLHHLAWTLIRPLGLGLYVWNDDRGDWGHLLVHGLVGSLQAGLLSYLAILLRRREALLQENATLGHSLRRASDRAARDGLTGLFNRHHLEGLVVRLCAAREQAAESVVLCLIDIDHFKQVNDRHGHAAGDEALRAVAETIRSLARPADCPIRYGGEEFLLVLRGASPQAGLQRAEFLRERIARRQVPIGTQPLSLTASFGLAAWAADESFDAALRRADAALYAAKARGRNRVEASWLEPQPPQDTRLLA